jgi:6-phosphofructokinase 2
MKPILTLTLNPTIDGASEAERVRPIHKVRTSSERFDPGGGGVNVARVVVTLGGPAFALYLAGGVTGVVLDELLRARAIPARRIDIAGDTRISHTVFERATGLEYRFVPEGPQVSEAEWRAVLAAVETADFEYVVASGSLPRGAPVDFYARLSHLVRKRGARMALDTSGEALKAAVAEGGLHFIKPSQSEFEALAGVPAQAQTPGALEEAARALVAKGGVELLAVTLGHEGAVLADGARVLRLPALKVEAKSAVGAGDSFVAAMSLALVRGQTPREAFLWGMAAGTAAVLTPGTDLCRREDVERLREDFAALAAGL